MSKSSWIPRAAKVLGDFLRLCCGLQLRTWVFLWPLPLQDSKACENNLLQSIAGSSEFNIPISPEAKPLTPQNPPPRGVLLASLTILLRMKILRYRSQSCKVLAPFITALAGKWQLLEPLIVLKPLPQTKAQLAQVSRNISGREKGRGSATRESYCMLHSAIDIIIWASSTKRDP